MSSSVIFSYPESNSLAKLIESKTSIEMGNCEIRHFPDGETYVRINTDVSSKNILLMADLHAPDNKILPILTLASTAKELGANKICLIAPYLPYMRQDKRFKPGEAVTSSIFANIISDKFDHLITIDPHLHRINQLSDIYKIPHISTLHAVNAIAQWINEHIDNALIIGPDEESRQWVSRVASLTQSEFIIIEKIRYGDTKVSMKIPDIHEGNKTLVFVDDIISTGTSMMTAIKHIVANKLSKPVCVTVHALFDMQIYNAILAAGARDVISCNTIPHFTNKIDVSDIIINEMKTLEIV